jgi:hypothetical protein
MESGAVAAKGGQQMHQHDSFQRPRWRDARSNEPPAIELSFRFACSFFNRRCIFGSTNA